MRIRLTELDLRQAILGGVALLLILVHMIWPGAGVDAISLILLGFFALVLYGDEATAWLARIQKRRLAEAEPRSGPATPASDLLDRVRDISYQAEHARVAGSTDAVGDGGPVSETLQQILDRAGGQPRAALLLLWGVLEDRLRAVNGVADGVQGARLLAEQGRVPSQFVDAYSAFRSLRNDVARAGHGDVTDELLWSLIDVGGALLALTPKPRSQDRLEF